MTMCLSNEAAAIKLAERDNLVGELVEALQSLFDILDPSIPGVPGSALEKARAVLAKAREGAQS